MRTKRLRERGAAMVEAVVVIPVLILLWVSLYYAGRLALTQQKMERSARSCAWLYSANNCDREQLVAIAPECDALLSDGAAAVVPPEIEDTLEQGAQAAMNGGDAQGIVQSVISGLVVTPLAAAFTSAVDAKAEQELPKPTAYGGGVKIVTGRYHLACNLARDTPEKMADRAWRTLVDN